MHKTFFSGYRLKKNFVTYLCALGKKESQKCGVEMIECTIYIPDLILPKWSLCWAQQLCACSMVSQWPIPLQIKSAYILHAHFSPVKKCIRRNIGLFFFIFPEHRAYVVVSSTVDPISKLFFKYVSLFRLGYIEDKANLFFKSRASNFVWWSPVLPIRIRH